MRVPTLGYSCFQKILSRERGLTMSKILRITSSTGMGSHLDSKQLVFKKMSKILHDDADANEDNWATAIPRRFLRKCPS